MKRKIALLGGSRWTLNLWIAAVFAVAACEDDAPQMQRGGEPAPVAPTADKGTATPPPDKGKAPPKEETKPPVKAEPPAAETPQIGPAPRPKTIPPNVRLSQEVDFNWPGKNDTVEIKILRPHPGQVLRTGTVSVQVKIVGFKPAKGKDGKGNHLRVLLDNERPQTWFDAGQRALSVSGLSPGIHSLRVFAATSWGESIKANKAFDAVNFYVRVTKNQPDPVDFSKPLLSYSQPQGTYTGRDADRILLDYHLANAELSPNGLRVRVTLDGGEPMDFTAWSPVWLEALPEGEHKLLMSLLNKEGKPVSGPFNDRIERRFTVVRSP